MRIGLLTSDLSTENGWANYSLNLIRQLRAQGIETTIVCARNTPQVEFETHALLPALTPPEGQIFIKSMRQWAATRYLLREADIIHATVEPFAILALAVAGRRPLFLNAQGTYVNLPRMRRAPVGQLYGLAFSRARLLCASRYTARVARGLAPRAWAQVVNLGVDAEPFLAAPRRRVAKSGPVVITVGGIKPRKGTLQLVQAMAAVRERLPDAQCLIMGNPQEGSAYTTRVRQRIHELRLENNVEILGFVDDDLMRAWLAAADVFALPAMNDGWHFEGFGLAVLEASAAGTAVIGTDNCGVADTIEDGVTGLVIPQAQVAEALPRALLELLNDPERAARMGAAGRKRARAQTWKRVADQVINLYHAALN